MATESGFEEFVLIVRGARVKLLERVSADSCWSFKFIGADDVYWRAEGWKIVKGYFPDTGQRYWGDTQTSVLDSEIGYHEQRLSALERLAVMCYVARYWDIPF